jgi:hypothetical protein
MTTLAIVILNFQTPELTVGCLDSVAGQAQDVGGCIIVVDNGSKDGSLDIIQHACTARGLLERDGGPVRLIASANNGGFASGNNLGIRSINAKQYLLLNSDTLVRPGAIATLIGFMDRHPDIGISGPRLEWPDGRLQISTFRARTALGEFVRESEWGLATRLLPQHVTAMPPDSVGVQPEWLSGAALLIRREVFDKIGLLDEEFFMYFEDMEFCTRARRADFGLAYVPTARVVHLRGGTATVKNDAIAGRRLPPYYYSARAAYHKKRAGAAGLFAANLCFTAGCVIRAAKGSVKRVRNASTRHAWIDVWCRRGDPRGNQPSTKCYLQ